jgi:hypothetical protein
VLLLLLLLLLLLSLCRLRALSRLMTPSSAHWTTCMTGHRAQRTSWPATQVRLACTTTGVVVLRVCLHERWLSAVWQPTVHWQWAHTNYSLITCVCRCTCRHCASHA